MTREEAKKWVDLTLFGAVLETMLNSNVESLSRTDALCFAYSMLVMDETFPKVDRVDKDFGMAVAAQTAILVNAIDDGALSKQYIYDSYVDLVRKASEKTDRTKEQD